jgi:hypothetical protein
VRLRIIRWEVAFYQLREGQEDLIMTLMRILSLAAFLAASLASPVFAATGGDTGQGITISPNSPTTSAPNMPSHDGNNQLGYMGAMKGTGVPGGTPDQASTARAGGASDATNPSNNPSCGGTC